MLATPVAWGSSGLRCLWKTLLGLQDCWCAWHLAGLLVGTWPGLSFSVCAVS